MNPPATSFRHGRALAAILAALALLPVPAASPARAASPEADECAGSGGNTRVQLVVDGLRSAAGTVTITVYGDRPEDFLARGKRIARVRLPARQGPFTGCLSLPKPGTYALAAYHDEDGNRRLTRGAFGIPVEGYAFSNNPPPRLGVPRFDEVAVTVAAATTVRLQFRYP